MSFSKNSCPVPFNQQPLNEYLILKDSWLFSCSMCDLEKYIINIFIIFSVLLILNSIIISLFFFKINNLFEFLLLDCLASNFLLFCLFIRIYLGLSYIFKRLLSATIFYEESGWYDGQVWVKTSEYLIQDRLIGLYQIMPYLNRIKYTCLIILFNLFSEFLFYSYF
uniref:Ycf36 n=1 Tax=Cliftonaea pectinata TaxID=2007206 RepID=A0A1Z1MQR9_9FLOR|nr:hypothetical protein [Cliftonaea pectinata]ARW68084.1 hypothetical protein [Cliftonaea pectinata]